MYQACWVINYSFKQKIDKTDTFTSIVEAVVKWFEDCMWLLQLLFEKQQKWNTLHIRFGNSVNADQ